LMSSNAVVTSPGGLATDPAVAWVAIQATIVLTSVFTVWTSGLVAHAWTVGASAAAVDASMLGHAAASFAWKSAQKLWRPADIEAEAVPDGSSEAAMDGSTDGAADSTLGRGAAVARACRRARREGDRGDREEREDGATDGHDDLQEGWFFGSLDRSGPFVPTGGVAYRLT